MMRTDWAPEAIELLRQCAAAGATATQAMRKINAQFGLDLSRNAIIGKARRAGFQWQGDPGGLPPEVRAHRIKRRARKPKPIVEPNIIPAEPAVRELPADGIPEAQRIYSVLGLTNETCRWPHGEPGKPDFFFCGHPSADMRAGRAYCENHGCFAYRGVTPVGRDRGGGRDNGTTVGPDPVPARSEMREGQDQRGAR